MIINPFRDFPSHVIDLIDEYRYALADPRNHPDDYRMIIDVINNIFLPNHGMGVENVINFLKKDIIAKGYRHPIPFDELYPIKEITFCDKNDIRWIGLVDIMGGRRFTMFVKHLNDKIAIDQYSFPISAKINQLEKINWCAIPYRKIKQSPSCITNNADKDAFDATLRVWQEAAKNHPSYKYEINLLTIGFRNLLQIWLKDNNLKYHAIISTTFIAFKETKDAATFKMIWC